MVQPLPLPEGVSDAAVGAYLSPAALAPAPSPVGAMASQSMYTRRSAHADAAMEFAAPAPRTKPKSYEQPAASEVVLQRLSSDRPGLKLAGVQSDLEARLMGPALARLLADLPNGAVLTLRVDASGQVLSASFDQYFPGSASAVALMETWSFADWGFPPTTLRATLRLR